MSDAFNHLKAIAVDRGGRELLIAAKAGEDAGVVDVENKNGFIAAAKKPVNGTGRRRWENIGISADGGFYLPMNGRIPRRDDPTGRHAAESF